MDGVRGWGGALGGPLHPQASLQLLPQGGGWRYWGGVKTVGVDLGGWLPPPRLTPFLAQAKGRQKRVKAVADCKGDKARELTFSKGEVIVVTREEDEQSWVSPPGAQPPPSPPHFPVILSGLLIFGGSRMGTPRPVCAGGGHRRLPVTSHKCLWPSVPAFLSLATHRGTPPHPLTPLSAPPGRLHRGRRLPHWCLPRQLRPPLARLTGSPPPLCPFCPRPLGAGGARGGLGAGAGRPPAPLCRRPFPRGTGSCCPTPAPAMGPCGCCPPRGRGDPRGVGRSPPGRWLWRAEGLPPPLPPSAAPCEEVLVLALLWLLSVLSWALPIPGAFSSPVSGDLGLGGGALGAPHSPLLGGRRALVPVLQGGAAMRHLVFSTTTTVKHWGLVGNKKGLFIHRFWGFGGSAATSFPPHPGL